MSASPEGDVLLPQVRLAAIYYARQHMDYLDASVRSVLPFVETVLIGVSSRRRVDRESLTVVCPGSGDVRVRPRLKANGRPGLHEAADKTSALPEIHCIEGEWKDEVECATTLLNELSPLGITHALLMEPEDVLAARDLDSMLEFVKAHPEVGQFLVRCHDYWKSPSYRIDPPDPEARVLISKVTSRTRIVAPGRTNESPVMSLPETAGALHRFTFASPSKVVKERVATMELPPDTRQRWETEVWQSWNGQRSQRNLHPTSPERFRVAQRTNLASLPQSLSSHPYLQFEIAGESRRTTPTFSVLFEAVSDPDAVETLLENLARTAPDCFEWIACVPEASIGMAEFLRQKPGGKVAVIRSESPSPISAWNDGVRMAEGEILVFLQDHLHFEGDWLEGIQAAMEQPENRSVSSLKGKASRIKGQRSDLAMYVYLPRIARFAAPEWELEPSVVPQSSMTARQLLFEQTRGRFYGELTSAEGTLVLEELPCWACSRNAWTRLAASFRTTHSKSEIATPANGDTQELPSPSRESGLITALIVEDTLVFSARQPESEISALRSQIRDPKSKSSEVELQNSQSANSNSASFIAPCPSSLLASIIIPVFNNLHLTQQCLDSIFQNTTLGLYEVIVVDNGSTDGSREYLQSLEPRIRYIRNPRNLFFARGCNRGAWAAGGENLLFLNNDTVVKPGWLEAMLEVLAQSPKIGIVGNKQLFPASNSIYSGLVWHAGMTFTEQKDSWHVFFGFDADHPAVNVQRDYPCVTGCCLLIRKALFEELRGFDPWFQNGYEDTDLCLRAGELGVRIVYTPKSEIVHHVSASESRFDRHVANFLRFRERWAERILPSELQCYRDAGLIKAADGQQEAGDKDGNLTPGTRGFRVGFVSAFNQQSAFADYAGQLLAVFPPESFVVLSDYAVGKRLSHPDPKAVIRCWDPSGSWLQPLARWIHALDLEVLHVNLDLAVLQKGFFNVLKGARESGKKLVFTLHHTSPPSALLRELCDLADAVIVHSPASRMELILNGCESSKIHVLTPGVTQRHTLVAEECIVESPFPDGALREKLGLGVFSKIIATPGFVSRRKGILEVIDSLAAIRNILEVHYLVLGTPDDEDSESAEYLKECRTLVHQLRLERQVTFVDRFLPAEELSEFLRCADAVVLPYQTGRHAWSSAAALALSLGRPVITNGDPMFSALGDAVLRTTGGLSLAQAIVSVLTNPFLADQLKRQALDYAGAHTWQACEVELWKVYDQVLATSDKHDTSRFVQYQVWNSHALRPSEAEKLLPQLKAKLSGRVIEFASRSLELTEAIRPVASVTWQNELVALAKSFHTRTPFLTLDEFTASTLAGQVFDTILLHLSEEVEPCARLVRALLPHLSPQQKLLLVFDVAKPESIQAARQFQSVGGIGASRVDLGCSLQLIELAKNEASKNCEGLIPAATEERGSNPSDNSRDPKANERTEAITTPRELDTFPHVCWEGPQLINHSLALVNREIEHGLLASGRVHLSILPVGADSFAKELGAGDRKLKQHYGRTTTAPVDVHVRHQWPPNWTPPAEGHFVVIQPWEYGSLPVEWVQQVNALADEVWVPSSFVRDLYVESGVNRERVHVIPNGVDTELFTPVSPPLPICSRKKFRFLFVGGTIARKGVDLLLQAFQQSFSADDDVALVVKDMGTGNIYQGQGLGDRIRQIQRDPRAPEILYLDQDLSAQDIAALYTACHCLVHPYRGEGFALPVLEAMSSGLPVIVTEGGATDDFVDESVGYRIPARKLVFGNREISGMKTVGDLWMLEPDSQKLSEALAYVFRHREEAQEKGRLGRRRAETEWTWKLASQRALARINHLRRTPVLRCQQQAECAVLMNVPSEAPIEVVRQTLNSLVQNSYATLKIYLRSTGDGCALEGLAAEFPQLTLVSGSEMPCVIAQVRREVRAPYLALLSTPMRFSKQWLTQIASIGRQVGGDFIVAPSVDLDGAGHYVRYEGNGDDHAFQKFSRALWRSQRSKFQLLVTAPEGCAVMSWSCLERDAGQFASTQEWLQKLRESGVPAYWAQDTFVGRIETSGH
jgi:glycosyltransferase involved in cell wall biosynthesis